MTFSFRPLSLAEAHRRRADRTPLPFFVDLSVLDTDNATQNEEEPEVVA